MLFISASCSAGRLIGRLYTGPSWATVRGGTSTIISPSQVITKCFPSVTSPITVETTSHFLQISKKRLIFSGETTAHILSCDSLIKISSGERFASRNGTLSNSINIPPAPAEANSLVAQDKPAPPKS